MGNKFSFPGNEGESQSESHNASSLNSGDTQASPSNKILAEKSDIQECLRQGKSPQHIAMWMSTPEIVKYAKNLDEILTNLGAKLVINETEQLIIKVASKEYSIDTAFEDLIGLMYNKNSKKVNSFLKELQNEPRNKAICDQVNQMISDIQKIEAEMSQAQKKGQEYCKEIDETKERISFLNYSKRVNGKVHPKGPKLNFLLLGKTGVGKSKLGNNILENKKAFEAHGGPQSVTSVTKTREKIVRSRHLEVVDTPGSMDTHNPERAIDEIAAAVARHPEGYDALLLSVSYGTRFTAEEIDSARLFKALFHGATNHTILVITHGSSYRDDCDAKDEKPDFHTELESVKLSRDESTFGPLYMWCEKKWILVENCEKEEAMKIRQMNELVEIVDGITNKEGGRFHDRLFEDTLKEKLRLLETRKETADTIQPKLQEYVKNEIMIKFNCFPCTASVVLFPGIKASITDICSGNQILCFNGEGKLAYGDVYMIAHKEAEGFMNAITITTKSRKLTASEGHYIVISSSDNKNPLNSTKLMRDVSIGDNVLILDPNTSNVIEEEVTEISKHIARGKYNPITFSGTIVVDGVVATCYEEHVRPRYAHLALGIIRMLYKISPAVVNFANSWTYRGIPYWAYGSLKAITYFKN